MIIVRCNRCKRDVEQAYLLIVQEESAVGALTRGRMFEPAHLCQDCLGLLASQFGLIRPPPPTFRPDRLEPSPDRLEPSIAGVMPEQVSKFRGR